MAYSGDCRDQQAAAYHDQQNNHQNFGDTAHGYINARGQPVSKMNFAAQGDPVVKTFFRTADSKGGIALPGFTNAKVIIEIVDDTEYRVRKMQPAHFHEEDFPLMLSERDAARLIQVLRRPPAPNRAARRAARRFGKANR
jgi:hypothetical protein